MTTKIKNDSTLATTAGADARGVAFRNWAKADGIADGALVACYVAVAMHGATSPQEVADARGWHGANVDGSPVPNGSAKAYASAFNRAAKVATLLGVKVASELVAKAAATATGRTREAIADALGSAMDAGKGEKKITAAKGRAIMKAALVAADMKESARKSKVKVERAPRQPVAAAALAAKGTATVYGEVAATLRTMAVAVRESPVPEGREAAARDALAALQEACEAFACFMK